MVGESSHILGAAVEPVPFRQGEDSEEGSDGEAQSVQVLITLGTSAVGAFFGTLMTVMFVRRNAVERVLGEEYAKRRLVLVERIAAALDHVAVQLDAFMSNEPEDDPLDSWNAPARGRQRAAIARQKLRKQFFVDVGIADLYLSEDFMSRLRRYESWLRTHISNEDAGALSPLVFDVDHYTELRVMLREAILHWFSVNETVVVV